MERRHAAGVAAVATIIGMAAFVLVAAVANSLLLGRLYRQVDARLQQQLNLVERVAEEGSPGAGLEGLTHHNDRDDVPIYVWRVSKSAVVHAYVPDSPRLPQTTWSSGLRTQSVGKLLFRFSAVRFKDQWLVAGESLADVTRVNSSLIDVETAAGGVLLVLMFVAAFVVGMRALTPVARARRRQAEFTSDASHELRTPLSVIEAEVDLALSRPRDPESYRATLRRVVEEERRLHRIVEDLLWLARTDETRAVLEVGTCDLGEVTAAAQSRFDGLASRSGISLEFDRSSVPTTVRASADSIDRLVGVLVDNACKFAGPGGHVLVSVRVAAHRSLLTVEDSGPGIPVEQRDIIFDRFHRTDSSAGGTGLGLAIADSIIKSTHAHCVVGESALGGARFEVSWRHHP